MRRRSDLKGNPIFVGRDELYPDLGLEEPLREAAERYELDAEALIAAASAAIAAPDREVTLELADRAVV